MNLQAAPWKKTLGLALVAALGVSALVGTGGQHAYAALATPDYEVKLVLDPSVVLDSSHKLVSAVRSEFGTGTSYKSYRVQYMDTPGLVLDGSGWSNRIRKRQDQSTTQIQYKKRYAVTNGDINAALTQASADGFNSSASDFDAQVDWGYAKQTLSFDHAVDVTVSGYTGLNTPNLTDSRQVAVQQSPSAFTNWSAAGWGTAQLNSSVIYGPVDFIRYTGTYQGLDLDIEVWTVRNAAGTGYEYLTEASFKTDSYSEASSDRTSLISLLSSKGWLVPQDGLRTQLILERYAPVADTTAPSAPTGVTAAAASSSQINVSWAAATDNVGVTGYDVFRDGTLAGSATGTSFSDTGLAASTTYSYTIKAKDAAGNVSAASTAATAATLAAGTGTLYYAVNGSSTSYIEAETYTDKAGSFSSTSDSSRSNGAYMSTPNGSGNDGTANYIKYELNVTNGGSFYIFLLSTGPDGSSDSFTVSADSGTGTTVTTGSSGTWAWKKSSTLSMATGTHTLYIRVREDGAKVDKIAISKSSTTPTGLGGTALTPLYH